MYKTTNGIEVYETFEDLDRKGITSAWEYEDKFYVRVKLDDNYDNSIWVIDQETQKVSWIFFTDFIIDIEEKATRIDVETLRERMS